MHLVGRFSNLLTTYLELVDILFIILYSSPKSFVRLSLFLFSLRSLRLCGSFLKKILQLK